ncbi:hypothetical protein MPLDJ20_60053 [Mesorhizobium plurifarium]|uniref:Uncharacterized protein n=1 Tax=Mesorhizobium plurifarium TaxID=69974 RepID=A0A090FML8_MESPL|nr:hypothetical protein MPLDJ20_60053 [Mesorhizobium plurifarium]
MTLSILGKTMELEKFGQSSKPVPATNVLASYPFQVDVVSRSADPQSEFLQLGPPDHTR